MISENNESCAEMGNSMNERIKVIVMSRLEAYQYCKKHHDKPSAIISISTPYNIYDYCVFKSEENQVIDILELSFVDADEPDSLDVNDIIAAEKDLLCDKDAERIVEFSEKYKNKLLIIHCDAGISRSSGIAAAILRHYTGDDAEIFDNYSYDPNMWCYFKTLKAFGDELF